MFLLGKEKIINMDDVNKIYWYFGRYTTVEAELKDKSKIPLFYITDEAYLPHEDAKEIIREISEHILKNKNVDLTLLEDKDKGINLCA